MDGAPPEPIAQAALGASRELGRGDLRVFVTDEQSEAAILAGLPNELATATQIDRGDARTATRMLATEPTPSILVVDVSRIEDAVGALSELAGVCSPDVQVLVVGEQTEIAFYRKLVHDLGVGECLFKPLTHNNVATYFGPFFAPAAARTTAPRGGHVVAVCGAHGGVGATTIALQLALQLEETKRHIALLDLHLRGGTTAMMLGVRPSSGLRLALEEPDRIDSLFVDRMAIRIRDRLRLIAAEEPFAELPAPKPEATTLLLSLLRQRFSYIVVDLPTPPAAWDREVLGLARDCIVVVGPDVVSIRDGEALHKLANSLGRDRHVIFVLNRAGLPGGLKAPLIAEGLGRQPEVIIPDLPKHLPRAANLGQPVLAANAALRRAMAPLVREIFGVAHQTPVGGRRSLLGWMLHR